MDVEYNKWRIIETALDVAEGKLDTTWGPSSIDESYFLYHITSDRFTNHYKSTEDRRSVVRSEIRNWRISQIEGRNVQDLFVIELPRGDKVQLLPELGKRLGIRRLDSDDVTWLPFVGEVQGPQGFSGPIGSVGLQGLPGPPGVSGKSIQRSKYQSWIDSIDENIPEYSERSI